MEKIHVLDQALVNKIAAGEVIERPASVVKELIENSLDAKAKKILIEAREGGKSLIKVTDDGIGMSEKDAGASILPHATSKIKDVQDLFNISTLGFRGEALPSIASVSRLRIRTKDKGSSEGTELDLEAGMINSNSTCVCNTGTAVIVQDLFFNVPARKKHLKTIQTELSIIADVVSRYALANPDVYFQLVHDGRSIINSPDTKDWLSKVADIYGWKVAKSLLPVDYSSDGITIKGFVSKPDFSRGNKAWQSLYINGRYVKSTVINNAIYEGYHTLLNVGRHPVYVLMMELDPKIVDVNVHPTKRQVRFSDEKMIAGIFREAVHKTLSAVELVPQGRQPKKKIGALNPTFENSKQSRLVHSGTGDSGRSMNYGQKQTVPPKQRFRIVGQVMGTYLCIENEDGLMLVDQHAAHERVMYERYMEQYHGKGVVVQELLSKIVLDLTPQENLHVAENLGLLARLGFRLEPFGKQSYILRTVPYIFGRCQHQDVLRDIIYELMSEKKTKLDKAREERIIRRSCRSAVKANERLEYAEIVRLMNELFETKNPYTCPHGRPTMIRFTKYDIEKMFKRKL